MAARRDCNLNNNYALTLSANFIVSHRRSSVVNANSVNPRNIHPAGRSKSTKVKFMMKPRARDIKVVAAAYRYSRIDVSKEALRGLSGQAVFTLVEEAA